MNASTDDTTHPVRVIPRYANFESDILSVLDQNEHIRSNVGRHEARYEVINVTESLSSLANVGELLSVAYMGSKGFQCNAEVIRLLANYQTLGKDSLFACNRFMTLSMEALENHRMAFEHVQAHDLGEAFEFSEMMSDLAKKMSKTAGVLAKAAADMCNQVVDALEAAACDNAISEKKRRDILEHLASLKGREASSSSNADQLADQVRAAREREIAAGEQSGRARRNIFTLPVVSYLAPEVLEIAAVGSKMITFVPGAVITGVTCLAFLKATHHEGRVRAERMQLEEQHRLAIAEIAELAEKIRSMVKEEDHLQEVLLSLSLANKLLGRIKTVYENTRLYWLLLKEHCSRLASEGRRMGRLADEGFDRQLTEAITDSWYSWLAIAKINHSATVTMASVMGDVDRVMDDLPATDDIRLRLDRALARLRGQLLTIDETSSAEAPGTPTVHEKIL